MAYTPIKKNCAGCGIEFMAKKPRVRFCTVGCSKKGIHSHMWKGEKVGIDALHTYIRKQFPKPEKCQCCKIVPPFDLANISGEYKRDVSDWEWLCRRCHMTKDGRLNSLRANTSTKKPGVRRRRPQNCIYCKKSFTPKRRVAKYCSSTCSGKHRTETTAVRHQRKVSHTGAAADG